jgi:hypothetical protein
MARRLQVEEHMAMVATVASIVAQRTVVAQRTARRRRLDIELAVDTNTVSVTHKSSQSKSADTESQQNQCSVCLEKFQEGEELRILPCFHKYHKSCIDRWFRDSPACPICKHSIMDTDMESDRTLYAGEVLFEPPPAEEVN